MGTEGMNSPGIKLSMIVAATPGGIIGNKGDMPWNIPSDMRRFRDITIGVGVVIMGRATHEAIMARNGRLLPRRHSIILTHFTREPTDHLEWARSVEEACDLVACRGGHACVIGGGQIYKAFMPLVERVHLTTVHPSREPEGDTHFKLCGNWRCAHATPTAKWDARDQYPTSYEEYVRG